MLREILKSEKMEILEWLEEYEDATVRIVSFKWKDYTVVWHGDFRYTVTPPPTIGVWNTVMYESYEDALDYIEKSVIEMYESWMNHGKS